MIIFVFFCYLSNQLVAAFESSILQSWISDKMGRCHKLSDF